MTPREQQQIVDLLNRQEHSQDRHQMPNDFSKGFALGWREAIRNIREYLESMELIPASEGSR